MAGIAVFASQLQVVLQTVPSCTAAQSLGCWHVPGYVASMRMHVAPSGADASTQAGGPGSNPGGHATQEPSTHRG
jgi:hypothetical protein